MNKCIKCSGSGRIIDPAYPDSLRTLDRRYEGGYLPYPLYESRLIAMFGSLGKVPEEYIKCPVCQGSGRVSAVSENPREGIRQ